jgi:diacylglycerol kinase (CTP)
MRAGGTDLTWSWDDGVRQVLQNSKPTGLGGGGALGLVAITVVSGIVSGVAEALGKSFFLLYRSVS